MPRSCGKLSIPFPFGVGRNCSLEPSFEIFCNTSTNPPRAYLSVLKNVEIIKFKSSQVWVKYPNLALACYNSSVYETKTEDRSLVMDLSETQFTISDGNWITAIGFDDMVVGKIRHANGSSISSICAAVLQNSWITLEDNYNYYSQCPYGTSSYHLANGCCRVSIPTDHNTIFSLWQVKMKVLLTQMDLNETLLGFEKMPSSWTNEDKKRKDRKALSHIHLHLSNRILQDVLKEKTVAGLWLKLERLCMTKSLTSKLHLKQRLYSYRMGEGTSLQDHISAFKKPFADLESLEVKYNNEDLTLILQCLLPSSYNTSRDTILFSHDTSRDTILFSHDALFSKEKMKELVNSFVTKGEDLLARGSHKNGILVVRGKVDRNKGILTSLVTTAASLTILKLNAGS